MTVPVRDKSQRNNRTAVVDEMVSQNEPEGGNTAVIYPRIVSSKFKSIIKSEDFKGHRPSKILFSTYPPVNQARSSVGQHRKFLHPTGLEAREPRPDGASAYARPATGSLLIF
eukprot:scaffold6342_cov206-Alexandrium_tamarense.AAC.31